MNGLWGYRAEESVCIVRNRGKELHFPGPGQGNCERPLEFVIFPLYVPTRIRLVSGQREKDLRRALFSGAVWWCRDVSGGSCGHVHCAREIRRRGEGGCRCRPSPWQSSGLVPFDLADNRFWRADAGAESFRNRRHPSLQSLRGLSAGRPSIRRFALCCSPGSRCPAWCLHVPFRGCGGWSTRTQGPGADRPCLNQHHGGWRYTPVRGVSGRLRGILRSAG